MMNDEANNKMITWAERRLVICSAQEGLHKQLKKTHPPQDTLPLDKAVLAYREE